jgi:hypothetical protein
LALFFREQHVLFVALFGDRLKHPFGFQQQRHFFAYSSVPPNTQYRHPCTAQLRITHRVRITQIQGCFYAHSAQR